VFGFRLGWFDQPAPERQCLSGFGT
jgi:hypothetical protein